MSAVRVFAVLLPAVALAWGAEAVRVSEEPLVVPTYITGAPDPNPMFYFGRTYQGAKGAIYPYPLYDKLSTSKENRTYNAVYLENEYVKICVLPELGGRIFSAVDKTNGYNFFYRQHVIKPALIGMLGAWISGGVEWNIPHHHRASSFSPVQYRVEESADGSRTVWVGETELRHRMQWVVGLTLRPGRSYVEATVRALNTTPIANSMLYFANVAVHANENYQIIFPPSTQFVTQHAKREFARWPIADTVYNGIDFTKKVDVSWWKNHPTSISMFAWNYEDDFLAGYDHGRQAGTLHVADHHVVPGKKFFTWGTGPGGRMWDKILSDQDGPYLELMVGGYSDNQPDYSWLQPYETKSLQQYWYPYRDIGGVKNANVEAAVNLEVKDGKALVGFYTTAAHERVTAILTASGRELMKEAIAISPAQPFVRTVALPAGTRESELRAVLVGAKGELVAYTPVSVDRSRPLPDPVRPPPPPEKIKTSEELYLAGLRLEQFHSPASEPDPYYLEALKRDSGDSRANTALGILYIRRGMFAEAEAHLSRAVDRVSANYTAPKDSEPLYYLGVALKAQGKVDEAEKVLQRAAWAYAWQSPAFYLLAEIYSGKRDYPRALDMLSRSLVRNAWNTRALDLQSALDRQVGNPVTFAAAKIQPLDIQAAIEQAGADLSKLETLVKSHPAGVLDAAVAYGNAGLREQTIRVLSALAKSAPADSGVPVMAEYYLGYYDQSRAAEHFAKASSMPTDFVFPFQTEAIPALRAALRTNPKDAHAAYYLGNLLFDWQPAEAVRLWEQARSLDPNNHILHRNLALAYARDEANMEKAIASMEKAVATKPDALHLYDLDRLYEHSGAPVDKRLAMLDRYKDVVRERDDVYSREISLRVLAGDYDRAVAMLSGRHFHNWEGGARINVRDPWVDAHLLRGQQRLAAKDVSGALMDYQAALDAPENLESARSYRGGRTAEVLYWIGMAQEAAGRAAEAGKSWREASALRAGSSDEDPHPRVDPGATAFFYRAAALAKLGERGKAESIYRELVAVGERAQKDSSNAADYFAKFGERQTPKQRAAMAHYVAGLGYAGLGETEKANTSFRSALALNPYLLDAKTRLRQATAGLRSSM